MDAKNRLTNRLLKIAKKHRILTYPVLALVALISVFSYFFNWSTGAGKRVVAIVMVMVMLVSQSCFLTSSATEVTDETVTPPAGNEAVETEVTDEVTTPSSDALPNGGEDSFAETVGTDEAENGQIGSVEEQENSATGQDAEENTFAEEEPAEEEELLGDAVSAKVIFDYVDYNGQNIFPICYSSVTSENGTSFDLKTLKTELASARAGADTDDMLYTYSGLYLDAKCSVAVGDSLDISSSYVIDKGDSMEIVIYCLREVENYAVTIIPNGTEDSSDKITYNITGGTIDTDTIYVPASGDANNKSGSFTISDFVRYGYDVAAPEVSDGGTSTASDDGGYVINLVGQNSPNRTVTLNWTGRQYQIRYCKKQRDDATITAADYTIQTLTYGSESSFYTQSQAGAVDYTGYDFNSWWLGSEPRSPGTAISMADHAMMYKPMQSDLITLYPQHIYVGIEVPTTEVEFQFGVPQSETIRAEYKYNVPDKDKNGQFTYTIEEGCITALQGVGITVTTDADGIYLNTAGPTTTTLSTPQELKFTVRDENNISTDTTITVRIIIKPQTVTVVVPDNWKVKDYDGNSNVNTYFTDTIPTSQKYPDGTDITVSRTGASYDSADAGENKTITITGCDIKNVPAQYKDCYVLEADAGTIVVSGCTIRKRTVIVHTTSDVNEIRAGEANPEDSNFGIVLDDGSSFVGDDNLSSLGEITYTLDPSREDYDENPYDRCYIIANAAEDSNYTVKCYKEDCAYFKVTKENPVLGTNYRITGNVSDADWYVGSAPVLEPIKDSSLLGGGYDEIRISYDGTSFTNWAKAVSLDSDKFINETIKIQLRSETGAITSIGSADIDYDPKGPTYLGYSFTVDGDDSISYAWDDAATLGNGGLYFPSHGGVLSFGTYINSTIRIKVRFEDTASGLKNLSYGIFTSDVNSKVTSFAKDGTATIEVSQSLVKDGFGVITCQAADMAGNRSEIVTLRPLGNGNDNYEWSVETREPSQCDLSVSYGDTSEGGVRGHVTGNSGIYYRNCIASVHVVENESGIKNVKWYVNDTLIDTQYPTGASAVQTPGSKITSEDFTFGNNDIFASSKNAYTVKAIVEDNAGNTRESGAISFLVDNDPPLLHVDYEEDVNKWTSNEEISFTTSDAISGVAYAQVLKSDGTITNILLSDKTEDGEYIGKFTITGKGRYTVKVGDNAGNIHTKSFNVQNISIEAPACPKVTITPESGVADDTEFWYNSTTGAPTIQIDYVTKTSDNTPVNTYFRHYKNDETAYDDVLIDDAGGTKVIPIDENDEAVHFFKFWSKSASGVECDSVESHVKVVRYDKTAPEITVANIPEKSSGSSVYIEFKITDAVSGVNKDSITVLRNGKPFTSTVEETEEGYIGSFVVEEKGNYIVMASDIAGNEVNVAGFTPMSMVVDPVNNITTSKAVISATVSRGTADVTAAPVVMLRKSTDEEFTECENTVAAQDENGNWSLSTVFDGLDANTVYVYKVRAVSDINEVLEYEGSLRTSSLDDEGGIIRGTTGYPNGMVLPSWNSNGIITVGLFEGNVCVAATTADAGGPFAFVNIPDGTYNIVATDGVYKKSLGITVSNHVVVSPSSAISLILSGHNTSVVIMTPGTPNVTADNMDSIFAYDYVNFNDEDSLLVEDNGTVEFRLYASLMDVANVSSDELSVIGRVQTKDKVVRKYLNLALVKIVTDADGTEEPPVPVTELSNGASITITIPLQDLAGTSGIEVVRVHNGSFGLEGYRYEVDMDSSPSTFTLTTNKFSTYAILAPKQEEPTTTEQPATVSPSTEGNTYEILVADRPATEQPTTIETNPTRPSSDGGSTGTVTTSFRSVSSSSGGTQTGDATPIGGLIFIMMISLGGVVLLKRKINTEKK